MLQQIVAKGVGYTLDNGIAERHEAVKLFEGMARLGWLKSLQGTFLRRSRELADLNALTGTVVNQHHEGKQWVALNAIHGSEGRCGDFDTDFYPLQDHNRERWLSVAIAMLSGTPLPPVELIRIGDTYYVRDGHHRISVSRALGQMEIEAIVTRWDIE